MTKHRAHPEPEDLIGAVRRFGRTGPAYEVLGVAPSEELHAPAMRIRVIRSGEELDYQLSDILADPED